ncbi:hypothetical protein B0O80DRAFT_275118 [Mortierella sp. GBAus27b]|nr:hypothetical protein B0O80DRAFT_275118 [Mortierella sp. GBAus27b]
MMILKSTFFQPPTWQVVSNSQTRVNPTSPYPLVCLLRIFHSLIPLRIAYHPGVVLDVIVADDTGTFAGVTEAFGPPSHQFVVLSRHTSVPNTSQPVPDENNIGQKELQQLKQQTQEIQIQMEETLQRLKNTEQQTQQQLQLQISDTLAKMQQLQDWANGADRGNHLSLVQTSEGFSKQELATLNHHMFFRDHIHVLLGECTSQTKKKILGLCPLEPSVPRLFIILPKDPNIQHPPSSWSFRVHFLCECSSRTIAMHSKGSHEVHMTDHAGYDLKNPKEFFDKYGLYALSMMYMIKYGTVAFGYIVPPQSRVVATFKKHLPSACNIQQLVDATISYLEEVTCADESDMYTSPLWTLERTEQEFQSYLETNNDVQFLGNLTRVYSSWLCSEHQSEWNIQDLKDSVVSVRGTFTMIPGKIDIKLNSSAATKSFLDIVVRYSGMQRVKDKPTLTADCGRFSLTVSVQDATMTIKNLSGLAETDIDFIRQSNLTKLKISHAPGPKDEQRLRAILRQSPQLEELSIGSIDNRAPAIIDLVISERERMLQNGEPTALRIFELMEDGLEAFKLDRKWDLANHITATLTFTEGSKKLDMDTRLVLQNEKPVTESDWMYSFIRQYGWSISSLDTATMFDDNLAELLDKTTTLHGSSLTYLALSQYSLTTAGLDAMDRVIKRSQKLDRLRLNLLALEDISQTEKAEHIFERYGARMNELWLQSDGYEPWLKRISNKFPTKTDFPLLDHIVVDCTKEGAFFPHDSVPWLTTMISSSPRPTGNPQEAVKPLTTGLKKVHLSKVCFEGFHDRLSLVDSFDFSVILELKLQNTNIGEYVELMIGRIAGTGAKVPLETLYVSGNSFPNVYKAALEAKAQQAAPNATILL